MNNKHFISDINMAPEEGVWYWISNCRIWQYQISNIQGAQYLLFFSQQIEGCIQLGVGCRYPETGSSTRNPQEAPVLVFVDDQLFDKNTLEDMENAIKFEKILIIETYQNELITTLNKNGTQFV